MPSPKDRQTMMRAATADVIAWQDHGDLEARARAVASVEGFVRKAAGISWRRTRHLGIAFDELVAEGRLGALVAVDRFDRTRGAEYLAAAMWGIREHVTRAARRNSSPVAMPHRAPLSEVISNYAVPLDRDDYPDEDASTPIESLQFAGLARLLAEAIDTLDRREAGIVHARNQGRPLSDIGPEHGISGERARQIYNGALAKLRARLSERGVRPSDLH